jgi:hypothetical protein
MTALLDSPMFEIKTEARDRLYYKDYHYSAQFYLQNAPALRKLGHDIIDDYIESRKQLSAYSNWNKAVTKDNEQKLHNICNVFLAFQEPYKKLTYNSHIYFYTNSLEDLESIANHPDVLYFLATKADVCLPRDVVLLKEPKRKYRTYLKERWIPEGQTPVLRKFLLNRRDCYDFTPLFKNRLETWDKFYTMSHFFIDHDDPKDLLMLELVLPGLIRKTLPIQAK